VPNRHSMMSMTMHPETRARDKTAAVRLVRRLLSGEGPHGTEFDACRAVIRSAPSSEPAFQALVILLEGALADPSLDIDDTQVLVPLIKDLAAGRQRPEDLL